MTGDLLAQVQPEPKRDRFGRYMLPHPDSGREKAWTRVTTLAKSASDTFALTQWSNRMVAAGMARRSDLVGLAATADIDDKSTLNKIAEQAKEAAASSAGANSGTALHKATERHDLGEKVDLPPPWDADLAAYRNKMAEAGIAVAPQFIERIVVLPKLNVAGTFDRLVTAPGVEDLVITDVKSTRNIAYGWLEMAAQLATYSRSTHLWNGATGQYEPMPDVDRMRGLVVHLPVGQARCDLYWVDLSLGWEVAELCAQVRQWRADAKRLAQPYFSWADQTTSRDDLRSRVESASSVSELYELWEKADSEGSWTDTLTQAAAVRKRQLTSK